MHRIEKRGRLAVYIRPRQKQPPCGCPLLSAMTPGSSLCEKRRPVKKGLSRQMSLLLPSTWHTDIASEERQEKSEKQRKNLRVTSERINHGSYREIVST